MSHTLCLRCVCVCVGVCGRECIYIQPFKRDTAGHDMDVCVGVRVWCVCMGPLWLVWCVGVGGRECRDIQPFKRDTAGHDMDVCVCVRVWCVCMWPLWLSVCVC